VGPPLNRRHRLVVLRWFDVDEVVARGFEPLANPVGGRAGRARRHRDSARFVFRREQRVETHAFACGGRRRHRAQRRLHRASEVHDGLLGLPRVVLDGGGSGAHRHRDGDQPEGLVGVERHRPGTAVVCFGGRRARARRPRRRTPPVRPLAPRTTVRRRRPPPRVRPSTDGCVPVGKRRSLADAWILSLRCIPETMSAVDDHLAAPVTARRWLVPALG